jgi:hypothetical protein
MEKKIGCVIAYTENHNNYGTALVGYALIKKIQQLGYECEVIEYNKKLSLVQKFNFVVNALRAGEIKRLYNRFTTNKVIQKYPNYAKGILERTKAVNAYKEKKLIPLFKRYQGYDSLNKGSKNYNTIIVGSDQVWSPMSLPNKFFNLLFVDDSVTKIAYASSFGVSEIPKFQRNATGEYLNRFSKIGVRELQGKLIVENLSNKKAQVVADPTMLLSRKEWEIEISDAKPNETEPYIFCYFLGNNQDSRRAVMELKRKTGFKIITIRHMDEYVLEDELFGDEAPYSVGPNDYVKYISNATYVCTDSFHCSVFSIIFHRQFMTFYRFKNSSKTSRNSRIDSLYEVLGINRERIFKDDICNVIDNKIDYESVDVKLEEFRNDSLNFLKTSLTS